MGPMRIHIAAAHAGYELTTALIDHLQDAGHEVIDHGAHTYDAADDYPDCCFAAAGATVADAASLRLVIGGSGNGEQIAANNVPGTRPALTWNEETAQLARAHNDANVARLVARQHSVAEAIEI